MPKKSGLINETERAICARLRSIREHSKRSQTEVATELGITRAKFTSIEYGQTPLRYDLAHKICATFDISQIWLAEGVGASHPCHPLADDLEDSIPMGILFSEAYTRYIKPKVSQEFLAWLKATGPVNLKVYFGPIGLEPDKKRAWNILREIRVALEGLSPSLHLAFWEAMDAAVDEFCRKHSVPRQRVGLFKPKSWPPDKPVPFDYAALSGAKKPQAKDSQVLLDTSAATIHSPDMQALKSVPDLVARLKKLSKKFGSKAALARKLDVSRQAVDQWLNGKTTPSTDIAIKVMNLE